MKSILFAFVLLSLMCEVVFAQYGYGSRPTSEGSTIYGASSRYHSSSKTIGSSGYGGWSRPNILGGYDYSSGLNSRANILGGQDFSNGVSSWPNILGGYSYSNGLSSRRNIVGGQDYSDGISSWPNIVGGYSYSDGTSTRRNILGGQDVESSSRTGGYNNHSPNTKLDAWQRYVPPSSVRPYGSR